MRGYFSGIYFEQQSHDRTLAIIPAFHKCAGGESFASIQLVTKEESFYSRYDEKFTYPKKLNFKIGSSEFNKNEISLNINQDGINAVGTLQFENQTPIAYDIMGPFKYVPFMQCRHCVYSMRHRVSGNVEINGENYDFREDIGYIEGDRGRSFPKNYIWTQCLFENGSLMLSVADIPLYGIKFTGVIGVILLNKKEIRLATYLGAKARVIRNNKVVVTQGDYTFSAELLAENEHKLYAPQNGDMRRFIRESPCCVARYELKCGSEILLNFVSEAASFEFEMGL